MAQKQKLENNAVKKELITLVEFFSMTFSAQIHLSLRSRLLRFVTRPHTNPKINMAAKKVKTNKMK